MIDLLPGVATWAACLVSVVLGTAVQRLAGQGFGMVLAPVMTLIAPDMVPGTVLLLGLCVGGGAFLADVSTVERRDLPPGFAGRFLGAVIAAWLASRLVGTPALPLTVGCVVWLGVILTAAGLHLPIRPPQLFSAGTIAGIMGTLTGVGAPPMAILYSGVEARRSAATQNVFFAFGMAVSIAALGVAGLIRLQHLAFAVTLVPAVPVTLWAVRPLATRIARRSIRLWALGLAALAASVLILRSLLG